MSPNASATTLRSLRLRRFPFPPSSSSHPVSPIFPPPGSSRVPSPVAVARFSISFAHVTSAATETVNHRPFSHINSPLVCFSIVASSNHLPRGIILRAASTTLAFLYRHPKFLDDVAVAKTKRVTGLSHKFLGNLYRSLLPVDEFATRGLLRIQFWETVENGAWKTVLIDCVWLGLFFHCEIF